MRHVQYNNFVNTIPPPGKHVLSANQIYMRQERPRLSRRLVYEALEQMAARGEIEAIEDGRMTYYRKKTVVTNLALRREPSYNGSTRNKFSLVADPDRFIQALAPLRSGKSVLLWLEPPKSKTKNFRGRDKFLVALTPGQGIGFPSSAILVSVVGKGSAIVRLDEPKKVADLVLAGVPAKLANVLVDKLAMSLQGEF